VCVCGVCVVCGVQRRRRCNNWTGQPCTSMEYLLGGPAALGLSPKKASRPTELGKKAKKRPHQDATAAKGGLLARNKKKEGTATSDEERTKKKPRTEEPDGQADTRAEAPLADNDQQHATGASNTHGGHGGMKKKRRKKKPKQKGMELVEAELLGPAEQAAFFQAQYRAHDPKKELSSGAPLPTEVHFRVAPTRNGDGNTKRDVVALSDWLKDLYGDSWPELQVGSGQKGKSKEEHNRSKNAGEEDKGAPSVIIVTISATRACDIFKALHEFNTKSVKVSKLFARHIKLPEQVELLNSHPIHIAVGTPHRLRELCQNGALRLHRCKLVVLDMWKNAKGASLLVRGDEIQSDFYQLYFNHFSERVQKEQMHLAMF